MLSVALSHATGRVKIRTTLPPRPSSVQDNTPLPEGMFEKIKQEAFVYLILGHYRNQLLHLFLCEGLVALSLRASGDSDIKRGVSLFVLIITMTTGLS